MCVALPISACGTSANSNDRVEGAPTKAEFIKRADQICESTDKEQRVAIGAFMAERPGAKRTQSLNERIVVEAGLPPIKTEVEKLDVLLPPAGDESEIQAILDEVEEAIEVGEDDPSTMTNSGSVGPFAAASKLASKYGFEACAFPL
jgi:hypothetical protein